MDADRLFGSVVDVLLRDPQISEAKMFGAQGLKIAGKYFAMVYKGQLVVKLPAERVAALVAARQAEFFDPGHGRRSKEWAAVGPRVKTPWLDLAKEARNFVAAGTGKAGGRKTPRRKK